MIKGFKLFLDEKYHTIPVYHKDKNGNMITPLVRGLLSDIVAGLLLIFILNSIGSISVVKSIFTTISDSGLTRGIAARAPK